MAPYGQNLSDSERFNQPSDPSIVDRHDDDDDHDDIPPPPSSTGGAKSSSSTSQQKQQQQQQRQQQRGTTSLIVVPRSTRRKMVSDDVRRKTTALPGFSDWRTTTTTTTTSGTINDVDVGADSNGVVPDNDRQGRPRSGSGSGGRRRRRRTTSGGEREQQQRSSLSRPSSTASSSEDVAELVVVVVDDDDGRRAAAGGAGGRDDDDDARASSIARCEYERAYATAMSEVDASSSSRETSLSSVLESTFLRYVDERLGVASTRRASWKADDDDDVDDDGGPRPPPSSSISSGGAIDPPPCDGEEPTGTKDPTTSSPPSPAGRNDDDDDDGAEVVVVVESPTGRTSSRGRDRRTTKKRADHSGNRRSHRPSGGSSERPVGTRQGTRSTSAGSRDSLPSSDVQDTASVCSKRSSNSARSNLSNRSRSDRSIGSRNYQEEGERCIGSRYTDADGTKDNDDNSGSEFAGTKKKLPRKGFLCQIKQLASKVKNTLGELGGLNGVHKFQLGERARYKTLKIRDKNWMIAEGKYDVKTKTVAVEVVAVHIDAVLEAPYYTILLPDGSRKRTNWDSLMTLSEYKKIKSAAASVNGNGGKDDDPMLRNSSRMRSIFGFSSRSRGGRVDSTRSRSCSSRRGREQVSERERSTSRQSRRSCSGQRRNSRPRSSSNGQGGDDEDDSERSLSRQTSRSRSTHGSDSTHRDGSGSTKVCSNSDGHRSHRGRPRSQSPFPRRQEVEQVGDRHDRRSRSTKKHQHLSCPQPCAKSERTAFHDKKSTDSSTRRIKYERQATVRSGSSLEGNATKQKDGEGGACASDPNNSRGPLPRRSLGVSSERSGDLKDAKKSLACAHGIVVEDVNDNSSCW